MTEVVAALIEQDGKMLLCRRPNGKARAGQWEFPGGKVERRESPAQALSREIGEELGTQIEVGKAVAAVAYEYPDIAVHITLLRAAVTGDYPRALEQQKLAWVTPEQAKTMELCPADRLLLWQAFAPAGERCRWCDGDALMQKYHDEEWGIRQLHDDRGLFEFLTLEAMQCGLSWSTVLRKRAAMFDAFDGFDPEKVASYDDAKLAEVLAAPGIIHSAAKLRAMVGNAKAFNAIAVENGSFDAWLWAFSGGKTMVYPSHLTDGVPPKNALAEEISAAMKKRGFKYTGPVVVYAYMQAVGMVNDHGAECLFRTVLGGVNGE